MKYNQSLPFLRNVNQKFLANHLIPTSSFYATLVLATTLFCSHGFGAEQNVSKTDQGVVVQFGQAEVELSAATSDALRLSVTLHHQLQPDHSTFLINAPGNQSSAWSYVEEDDCVGIKTAAGKLLMNPRTGDWTLQDQDGKPLIPLHPIGNLNQSVSDTAHEIKIQVGQNAQTPFVAYGSGNGVTNLEQSAAKSDVFNGGAVIPYYWSPAGYAALAVTANDNRPASWQVAEDKEDHVTWTFPGSHADLYLMPAPSLKDAARVYARLTGAAPVPPRWAFGYLQSRWGWVDRAYIEETLKHFHDLNIPVDAFIFDFEWYTPKPDYELPSSGIPGFKDFGANTNLFPDLAGQIATYKSEGVHFVGIRKPRLGDDELLKMVRDKRWDLQSHYSKNMPARDLNFVDPDLREWYIQQSVGLIKDGVAGWWNDEGEATYTTYFYWNLAERTALDRYRPNARMWTLNRAFSPGTQRFGAAAWTGDIVSSWNTLAVTPINLLNWSLSGMPYGACDIGGFFGSPSPELMTRWMQAGVFFPVMRTHSEVHYQPHFPWLYGADALSALRQAIDLRYQLIPYYYSLAHETFQTGIPLMRPLVMEFPNDPQVANLSDEWLMGKSLLAAPILQEGGHRSVYLPASDWYVFNTNTVIKGSQSIDVTATLNQIPAYVRAGSILPLGPVIEHTSELPGGPLELQIYPGKNAEFTLVEDDGQSQNYLKGKIRRTTFQWDDQAKRLKWRRTGNYSGKDVFQKMRVVVFDPQGNLETDCNLTRSGSVDLKR